SKIALSVNLSDTFLTDPIPAIINNQNIEKIIYATTASLKQMLTAFWKLDVANLFNLDFLDLRYNAFNSIVQIALSMLKLYVCPSPNIPQELY
ncbi:MAG TPA: hypothetical protein PKY85_06095, partial [Nitrosomonas sp.]|nr:hypothetical protein [Nitrosomonas sp.]